MGSVMSGRKLGTVNNARRAQAYEKLGVKESDVEQQPRITSQLRLIGKILRDKNQRMPKDPMYYLHCSDSPDARKILDAYYSIPAHLRPGLPIEAYCFAAGVSPLRTLEVITGICVRMGAQISTVIASISHPRVVEKTVDLALNAVEDEVQLRAQTVLHKAVGFLPTPKGSQMTIAITQNARTEAHTIVAAPPPEKTIRTLVDAFNESRGLPPTPAALPQAEEAIIAEEEDAEE